MRNGSRKGAKRQSFLFSGLASLRDKFCFGVKWAAASPYGEWALLALILLLAAVLRMGWPGITEFKADEARLFALSLEMVEERRLALRGISSSVGLPNFPASVWLYAVPLLLWPHVYAATLFTGLLNTLAAAGCYGLVRRYWGVGAALAATLALAVSPWAVIFSRKIWAQNLLPLLVMGWALGALLAFVEKRPKFIILHFVCLVLAVQTHLAAAALVPATAVMLLIFWRRLDWRLMALGGALAAVTLIPFLLYLTQRSEQVGLARETITERSGEFSLDSFWYTAQLSLGQDIHSLAGPAAFQDYLAMTPDGTAVHWLWGGLMIVGLLCLAWRARRDWGQPQAEAGLIVLLWLFTPPLFFAWRNTPIFIHYFIAALPAQYIALGVGAAWAARQMGRLTRRQPVWAALRAVGGGLFLATAVLQLWLIVALLNFVDSRATPGGFGAPVGRQLAAVAQVERLRQETGAAEILLAGPGDQPELEEFPAVYGTLLRKFPHRFVDARKEALFPAETAVVLLLDPPDGVGRLYWAAASERYAVPLRPGEGELAVLALPAHAAPDPGVPFDEIYLLANWVNFVGYTGPEMVETGRAQWRLHWRPADQPDFHAYHFFTHLLDDDGRLAAQADAPAFRPDQWRAGDMVVSQFYFPWGEERPFHLRAGMYHYPAVEPVLFLDVAGNPYTDAVELSR